MQVTCPREFTCFGFVATAAAAVCFAAFKVSTFYLWHRPLSSSSSRAAAVPSATPLRRIPFHLWTHPRRFQTWVGPWLGAGAGRVTSWLDYIFGCGSFWFGWVGLVRVGTYIYRIVSYRVSVLPENDEKLVFSPLIALCFVIIIICVSLPHSMGSESSGRRGA